MIIFKVVNNKHNSLNECLNFEYNVLPNSLQCNFFFYNFTSIGQVHLPILHP